MRAEVDPASVLTGEGEGVCNCIGHIDTDSIVRDLLLQDGISIPKGERKSVTLTEGDILLVAQYSGPRLPEGTTTLPEGAKITWVLVQIVPEPKE